MKKLILFLALSYLANISAQIIPRVLVLPPFPQNFQDLLTRQYENVIELQNTSSTQQAVQLRFRAYCDENGVSAATDPNFKSTAPIIVPPNAVVRLTGLQMSDLFTGSQIRYSGISLDDVIKKRAVPEGYYFVCVQAFDYNNINVQLSPEVCSNPISLMAIEPPTLRVSNPMDVDTIINAVPQNIVFQWNTPSNLRADALATMKFRLKIIEVPFGIDPNQAMLSAPLNTPEFEVTNSNFFIYGTNRTPLVIGRRYAALVKIVDPQNRFTFRNNGNSEVITFVFGSTYTGKKGGPGGTGVKPGGNDTSKIKYGKFITGNVGWAYKRTEELAENSAQSLIRTTGVTETTNIAVADHNAGSQRLPLANANVNLYGNLSLGGSNYKMLIKAAKSDQNGNYSFDVNALSLNDFSSFQIEVIHASGAFNMLVNNVSSTVVKNGGNLPPIALSMQSFRLEPVVHNPAVISGDKAVLNVLMPKAVFDFYGCLPSLGQTAFNGQSYIIIAALNNAAAYRKLPYLTKSSTPYVIQLVYNGQVVSHYSLPVAQATMADANHRNVNRLVRNFYYDASLSLRGIVRYEKAPRNGVRISVSLNAADILTPKAKSSYETTTDASGRYAFLKLPVLKKGSKISVTVTDTRIRLAPFKYELTFDGNNQIQRDFDIISQDFCTVVGRVMDNGVPVSRAMVRVNGTSAFAFTTANGFFQVKAPYPLSQPLVVSANGLNNFILNMANVKVIPSANDAVSWRSALLSADAVRSLSLKNPTALSLNLGNGTIESVFPNYFTAEQTCKAVLDGANINMVPMPSTLNITLRLNNTTVAGLISFNQMEQRSLTASKNAIKLTKGYYKFLIKPVAGGALFLPFEGEVSLSGYNTTKDLTIELSSAIRLSGVVSDKATAAGLESEITAEGTYYRAVSDKSGKYEILVPPNQEFRFFISSPGYFTYDTAMKQMLNTTMNFRLVQRTNDLPEIKRIGGFKAKIDMVEKTGSSDVFSVTGSVLIPGNDRIAPDKAGTTLRFRNARLKCKASDTNAIPETELVFEEASLPVKLSGYAPGEVLGLPFLVMKTAKTAMGEFYGVIGGNQIVARFTNIDKVATVLPIKMRDAVVNDEQLSQSLEILNIDLASVKYFKYAFISPGVKLNIMERTRRFRLAFVEPGFDFNNQTYYAADPSLMTFEQKHSRTSVFPFFHFWIEKLNANMNHDGIYLNGVLKFNKIASVLFKDTVGVKMTSFVIGPKFELKTLTFDVSDRKALKWKLQKFEAQLTALSIDGLGTPNIGVGFGGVFNLTKVPGTVDSFDARKAWTIKMFKITNATSGISIFASFTLPADGFQLKRLTFKTPQGKSIDMTYNAGPQTFVFSAGGDLTYSSSGESTDETSSGMVKSVFPISIELFRLQSKDWSVFMAAKANVQIKLGPVSISLEKFLVSVGNLVTLDKMNQFLITGSIPPTPVGDPYEVMDESKTSWAIGIAGGIAFPIKGMGCDVRGSLLLARADDAIQVRLNEICIGIKNPSMEMRACVRISYSGNKTGFAGEGKLTTVKRGFEATFKYFAINGGKDGYEVGASIKTTTQIMTGPILWHSIGGGFDFNTGTQKYLVFLTGEFGPAGTPKEAMYVRNGRLQVAFDAKNCDAWPVIDGSGNLSAQSKDVGSIAAKIDFCRKLILITLKGTYTFGGGAYKVDMNGLAFAMTESTTGKERGSFFLGVNVQLRTMGDIANGNAFFALGINYRNHVPNIPSEVSTQYYKVDPVVLSNSSDVAGVNRVCRLVVKFRRSGRIMIPYTENECTERTQFHKEFHGIYLDGYMNVPRRNGSFGVSMSGFDFFNFRYDFWGNATVKMHANFYTGYFGLAATLDAAANASITVFGSSLNASAWAKAALNGGKDAQGWYADGNATLGMQLYNSSGAGCNSVKVGWQPDCCWDIHYPCPKWNKPWRWCKTNKCVCGYPTFSFKVCKSIAGSFSYRENKPTTYNFNLL